MKNKWTYALCVLMSVLCLMNGVAAAENYRDITELYQHWSETQMPDWVCSVVSVDGSMEKLAVVVSSQEAADALISMVEDTSSMDVIVAEGSYGYNEMLRVQDEISREYMEQGGPVVSIGTGLAVIDGQVVGFGESGKELRIVVGVLPEYAEEYRDRLQQRYGDMVYVEVRESAMLAYDVETQRAEQPQYAVYVLVGVVPVMAVAAAAIIIRRKKSTASEE